MKNTLKDYLKYNNNMDNINNEIKDEKSEIDLNLGTGFKDFIWKIVDSHYKNNTLSTLQINSYNMLIEHELKNIICDKYIKIPVNKSQTYIISFKNLYIDNPYIYTENRSKKKLYPTTCRNRDLSYETSIACDVNTYLVNNNVLVDKENISPNNNMGNTECKDLNFLKGDSVSMILSTQSYTKVELFKLPVMVRSSKCNLNKTFKHKNEDINDHGGYFIIKGKERVIVAQERINYNQIYVYKQKNNKYEYIAEIRSIKENADYSVLLQCKLSTNHKLCFTIPYITQDIPIAILFIAMNFDVLSIYNIIEWEPELYPILYNSIQFYSHMTQKECIEYISNYTLNKVDDSKKLSYTLNILSNEIFPHFGMLFDNNIKCQFLIIVIRKLLYTFLGGYANNQNSDKYREKDDRDHICNKRVEMVGDLIGNLIKPLFKRFMKSVQQFIEKNNEIQYNKREDFNIINILNRFCITQRIYYCFNTGNWGIPKSNYIRQGVSQVLSRLSYVGTVSHLRRLIVPIGKESRNILVRQTHDSTFGFLCPVETPEGQGCGIIKNFSLLNQISVHIDTVHMKDILDILFINSCFTKQDDSFIKSHNLNLICLYLNGIWIGSIEEKDHNNFIDTFRYYRKINIIPYSVSISYDPYIYTNETTNSSVKEIYINSDGGRILKPVFNLLEFSISDIYEFTSNPLYTQVNNIKLLWKDLIEKNMIVYIDGGEAESSIIAPRIEELFTQINKDNNSQKIYDYCDIHPSMMLGICASLVPFSNHSQAPRNVYSSAMSKQAIGTFTLSYNTRFDTIAHVLNYPQKRLLPTHISEICHFEEMPSGINCVVAIMTYTGFNQEDSVIINQGFIDRGGFMSTCYKTISTNEIKKSTHSSEIIEFPKKEIRNKNYNYSKLGSDGIIRQGIHIQKNDVLVGRVQYINDIPTLDCSLICKTTSESGYINKVHVTLNSSGYKHIKIKIQNTRIPEIGDKFASIHGQKGTCGMTYRQEDMPFTADGIVPDIILNPHAIPSRMTINMLMEMLCGKSACFTGDKLYSDPFCYDGEELIDEISKKLLENGYEKFGNEIMYNGFTGLPFKTRIFMGVSYYQRLKHLVSDKIHSRAQGAVQVLSRQPCAGRSREGGLRIGEMERDCMISHGCSALLKERLFDMSDPYQIDICANCGAMVNSECTTCNSLGDYKTKVYIPYACKLLFQELQAMCIKIRIKPSKVI
jgi:DNA-directed RNA polymerase II subunit RPB2